MPPKLNFGEVNFMFVDSCGHCQERIYSGDERVYHNGDNYHYECAEQMGVLDEEQDLKLEHNGYEISLTKSGEQVSYSVFRKSDGWEIICDFTTDESPLDEQAGWLKSRVDEFIKTKGKSEDLAEDYV